MARFLRNLSSLQLEVGYHVPADGVTLRQSDGATQFGQQEFLQSPVAVVHCLLLQNHLECCVYPPFETRKFSVSHVIHIIAMTHWTGAKRNITQKAWFHSVDTKINTLESEGTIRQASE